MSDRGKAISGWRLLLDINFSFRDFHLHLIVFRHMLIGLLYLLILGGGSAAQAIDSGDFVPETAKECIGNLPKSVVLKVASPQERSGSARSTDGRTILPFSDLVWHDSCTCPSLPSCILSIGSTAPFAPATYNNPTFARAPPHSV